MYFGLASTKYGNYLTSHFEVQHLLDGRCLLEADAYFNLGSQKGGT